MHCYIPRCEPRRAFHSAGALRRETCRKESDDGRAWIEIGKMNSWAGGIWAGGTAAAVIRLFTKVIVLLATSASKRIRQGRQIEATYLDIPEAFDAVDHIFTANLLGYGACRPRLK